jgi:hypothetical protein
MSCKLHINHRALVLVQIVIILALASRLIQADTGTCNGAMTTLPFTDVSSSNIFFCAIAQAHFSGLTNGTSATTYAPTQNVPREQMAAFITRTQDSALKRGSSRRGALEQWWTPSTPGALRSTDLGDNSFLLGMVCDGEDVWVTFASGSVKRVRASDGKLLQTWTGVIGAGGGIVAAAGRIFITGGPPDQASPGKIYVIDPLATPGAVSVFANDIGLAPNQITFDGTNLWTSNLAVSGGVGSISRVNVSTGIDSTFTAGFDGPLDILWDGANLWVLDYPSDLKRVDPSNGTVLESTPIIQQPGNLLFDGTNIWVSGGRNTPNNISVVRAVGGLRGTVLATLNAGSDARGMAFDGERVLVCNYDANSVFLFKAADFTPLGTVSTGAVTRPHRACSDGLHFWLGRFNSGLILRF